MGQVKGNKKGPKGNQPKRKRYNFEKRGFKRAVKDLEKHIGKHPNDRSAKDALPRIKQRYLEGR